MGAETDDSSRKKVSDSPTQTRDLSTQTGENVSLSPEEFVKSEWQIGDVILDLYEVTALLGQGGMGRVYKVRHRDWNIDLAVKSPRPEIFRLIDGKENFIREAEVWVQLGLHPHIVSCYYVRNLGGIPRVFAECIDGGSLSHWIQSRKLYDGGVEKTVERILDVAIQFAWGLDYAHQRGVVHQDVKPANVLVGTDSIARVSDFGLSVARALAGETANPEQSVFVSSGGMTPAYCSPEQADGRSLTRKTDIWSWAISIVEMFAGKPPCRFGPDAPEALQQYLNSRTSDPLMPEIPAWLADLLMKCFRKDPRERPRTLAEIVDVLMNGYLETTGKTYHRECPTEADLRADALNNRAISLMDIGRSYETQEILESALKVDPYHPESTFNHSMLAWRQGKITDLHVDSRLRSLQSAIGEKDWPNRLIEKADQERAVCEEKDFGFNNVLALHAKKKLVALRTDYLQFRVLSLLPEGPDTLFNDVKEGRIRVISDGAFDSSARYFITSDFEGFSIWDLDSQTRERYEALPEKLRISMLLPPVLLKDRRILYASNHTLFIWLPNQTEPIPFCVGHLDTIRSVSADGDEGRILTASLDGTVCLWNSETGKLEHSYNISSSPVLFACFSPDGKFVVACARDGQVSFWDARGERVKVNEFGTYPGFVTAAAVHRSGELLAVWEESWSQETRSIQSGIVRIYDLNTLRCLRSFPGLDRKNKGRLVFSEDGEVLFAHSEKIGLKSFRLLERGKQAGLEICKPQPAVTLLAAQKEFEERIHEARSLLLAAKFEQAHGLLRKAVRSYPEYRFDESIIDLFRALHSYGTPVSLAGYWCVRILQSENLAPVTATRFLPGINWITGTSQGGLQIWDFSLGNDAISLNGHSSGICKILKASGSPRIVTFDKGGHMRAWDLSEQKCTAYFDCHARDNVFEEVCLSADGSKAFSTDRIETLYVWDLEIEELDRIITLPKGRGTLNKFHTRDGALLLEFENGCIDMESGKEVPVPEYGAPARFQLAGGIIAGESSIIGEGLTQILSFDLSEDERYLVCGTEAGQIQLWELDWDLTFD